MATPMVLPDVCALCYESYGVGTFDVWGDDAESMELVLVNVCAPCRIQETTLLINLRAAYVGNGHPADCVCLECE